MPFHIKELHLLIVEDNLGDFVLIEDYLNEEIVHPIIYHAQTFAQAKAYLNQEQHIDVILLDLSLPDTSGEKLVDEIMQLANLIPVIVLTGYTDKHFGIKALSLGISDFLLKDELSASQLYKSIVYSIERRRIDIELKKSEEKYRHLFHLSPLPMWVFDIETLRFLNVNEAAISHYGYSKNEFLGMTIKDILPVEDVKNLVETANLNKIKDVFYGGITSYCKKNGERIHVEIQSNSIDFDGKDARLVLSIDITEKLKAEKDLKLSEQRFKALVQDGADLIAILDLEANYRYVSPTSESILGVDSTQFIGKNAFDYIHDDDKVYVFELFNLLPTQKRVHIPPFRFLDSKNNWRWIETIATNMMDDPAVRGIVTNSRDVTENIENELKIRESVERYNSVAKATSDTIWDWDIVNDKMQYNNGMYHMFGYKESEIENIATWWKEKLHPNDFVRVSNTLNELFEKNLSHLQIEYRFRCADGSYKDIFDRGFLVTDKEGNPRRMIGAMQDITERKEAENEIRKSNERFELATKATNDAIFEWDIVANTIYWGDGYETLFGYKRNREIMTPASWLYNLHPLEGEKLLTNLNEILKKKQTTYVSEYQFKCADGSYKTVFTKSIILYDNHHQPVKMIGAMQDVTRQKEEEHRLKLLESVITNATDAVLITEAKPFDEPGPRIVYVNDAFTKMTGYSKEEIMGRSPRMLQGPKSDKRELNRLRRGMERGETCEIEIINYKKNGEEFWVQMAIAPVADNAGIFTHFIAIERDVTERKKQEQEITKAIISAQEQERYQIGGELHDNVNQILVGALLALGMTKDAPIVENPIWVEKSYNYISMAIDEIRRLSHRLAPASFDETSLKDCFRTLLNSINVDHKYHINLYFDQFDRGHISNDIQLNLYRILQEQLKNIVKYSNATSIEVSVVMIEENKIRMWIFDNGKGFDTETVKKGIGLNNIKKRAELFFGAFTLHSSIGNGCEIMVEIPI